MPSKPNQWIEGTWDEHLPVTDNLPEFVWVAIHFKWGARPDEPHIIPHRIDGLRTYLVGLGVAYKLKGEPPPRWVWRRLPEPRLPKEDKP